MTQTPTDPIRDEAVRVLAEALCVAGIGHYRDWSHDEAAVVIDPEHALYAADILDASPALAADLRFSISWRLAVAALPEGYAMECLKRSTLGWTAVAWSVASDNYLRATDDDETQALAALAAKLGSGK